MELADAPNKHSKHLQQLSRRRILLSSWERLLIAQFPIVGLSFLAAAAASNKPARRKSMTDNSITLYKCPVTNRKMGESGE